MGWSYGQKPADVGAYIRALYTHGPYRMLRGAFVGLTYYAAVEETESDGTKRVFAAVLLVRYPRGEFGYKGLDEFMGPCESRCPASILSLLSPLPDDGAQGTEWARQWRARCEAYRAPVTDAAVCAWARAHGKFLHETSFANYPRGLRTKWQNAFRSARVRAIPNTAE